MGSQLARVLLRGFQKGGQAVPRVEGKSVEEAGKITVGRETEKRRGCVQVCLIKGPGEVPRIGHRDAMRSALSAL